MFKQLLTLTLLSLIAGNAAAMRCPLPSDWIHEPGKPWKLSAQAEQEGWKAVPSTVGQDSHFTTIPEGSSFIEARIFYYSNLPIEDGASCSYFLPIPERDPIVATTKTQFDFARYAQPSRFYLERVKYITFDETQSIGVYRCNTNADTPWACSWETKPQ